MRVLYLINSKEYKYHLRLSEDFCTVIPGNVLDMADGTPLGDRYYEIEEKHPDAVITFDLAGHALRTGNDTLSLNNICARFAHILFQKADRYGNDMKYRQNLSMFTYFAKGEDTSIFREKFSEISNICEFVPIVYKADNEEKRAENRRNIKIWWEGFKEEAML